MAVAGVLASKNCLIGHQETIVSGMEETQSTKSNWVM